MRARAPRATRTKATRAPGSGTEVRHVQLSLICPQLSVAASTVSSWFRGNHVDTEASCGVLEQYGDKQPMSQSDADRPGDLYDQEAGRQVPRLQVSVLPSG